MPRASYSTARRWRSRAGLSSMAVTVEIRTGSRRIVSYLLSPLVRYRQEVMRERYKHAPMEPAPQSNAAPFYRSRIAIDGVGLRDVPANFHVAPGMTVTADIKVGGHAVLNYLLGRVLAVASEGKRESSRVRRIRGPCAA